MRTISLCVLAACLRGQACPDFGSAPVAATWTGPPVALGCPGAPAWPPWHLYTPRHRALAPRTGFRPGVTTPEPALLVPYACTGLLFAPVQVGRVRAMGFVLDTAQVLCR
ncbi:MAG: hypothetical protein ACON4Z_08550 [Planctomycetota bacterium]